MSIYIISSQIIEISLFLYLLLSPLAEPCSFNLLILIILGGGKLHADKTPSSALKINTTGGQADGQHSSSTSIVPTSSSHKHSSSGSSASKSAPKSAGKGSSSSESKSSKSESHHHRSSSHHSSSKSKSSQHERYLSITICAAVIR